MKTFYTTPESEKHNGKIGQNPGSNTSQNNTELNARKQIEGTPFTIIRQYIDHDPLSVDTRYKYFLVMGNYRLTEPTETENETLEKLVTEHWNIIANIVAITCEKMLQQIQTQKEQPYQTESL